jgi:NAD(P)-dependent dehydrogenase (short-subunit alcohol dehydrogenase family)
MNERSDTLSGHDGGAVASGRTIALVTGANRGIGLEIARQLAGLGVTVLLAARDRRHGEEAAAELRGGGDEVDVRPIVLDVTVPATIQAAAKTVDDDFGRLDVLVNNAGISGAYSAAQAPGTADMEMVRAVFETNVFGVIRVTDAMLPLLARSAAARVVNVSSSVGSVATMSDPGHYFAMMPGSVAYAPSKTALNSVTVQYAKHLRKEGILVNAADPGGCDTDFTRNAGFRVDRTAAQGAAIAVRLATLGPDGPTGGFFNDDGPVAW